MTSILIIYSTTDGHTLEICECIREVIQAHSHQADLVNITDTADIDLPSYDKIVIGASIRYGKHNPLVYQFIKAYQALLESKPNALFSVNVVARKPAKNKPDTNPYMKKFLKQISWQPKHAAVFAGKINYPIYSFSDRLIIRFIMWMTKGPTDPSAVVDFTDWKQVEEFAELVCEM